MANFESANQNFPPGQLCPTDINNLWTDFDSHQLLGHLGFILPFVEQENFRDSLGTLDWSNDQISPAWYLNNQTWDATNMPISNFRCPSDWNEPPDLLYVSVIPFLNTTQYKFLDVKGVNYGGWTNYLGCSGHVDINGEILPNAGIFYARSHTRISDVADGLSNTILIGEIVGGIFAEDDSSTAGIAKSRHSFLENGIGCRWVFFQDASGDNQDTSIFTYSSRHAGRIANFAKADGSVSPISSLIELKILSQLMTRAGGEIPESDR